MFHRRHKIRHKPYGHSSYQKKYMLAVECILNLRKILYKYFVIYISATAAL